MFELDLGSNGGGSEGPWLAWSARGTQDGVVPPRSFYLRDESGKALLDLSKGFVLDIENMKTGWQHSEGIAGVAPDWKWNPSPSQMMQSPGEGWKMGFSIRCAIGGGKVATWEQSGAAAWQALTGLAPKLREQPGNGQLPMVRLAEAKLVQFKKGSTVVPMLEIVKWVARPDCLKADAVAGLATEPAPAPQPAPQAAPAPQPAPALDDAEF